MASFPYFNGTGSVYVCNIRKPVPLNIENSPQYMRGYTDIFFYSVACQNLADGNLCAASANVRNFLIITRHPSRVFVVLTQNFTSVQRQFFAVID